MKEADLQSDESSLRFRHNGLLFTYESAEAFQKRLANFRAFYQDFLERPYPEHRQSSFTEHLYQELGISIFGLSSVDLNNHAQFKGNFHPDTIREACRRAKGAGGALVAVWHHDLNWQRGGDDCLSIDDLALLSAGPFHMGLCGHTHRPSNNCVSRIEGYRLPVISAGSLCAGPRQRPESVGRSYNIIRIAKTGARVWVRIKEQRGTPWKDASVFGTPQNRQSWYDVDFENDESEHARGLPTHGKTSIRPFNPFQSSNAKTSDVTAVTKDYVHTHLSEDIQSPVPQIAIGARGSGKTALLLTLTLESQLQCGVRSFSNIGIYCPMKVHEISLFNGLGAVPLPDRKRAFSAWLSAVWAMVLVNNISSASSELMLDEASIVKSLHRIWVGPQELLEPSYTTLWHTLRDLRDSAFSAIGAEPYVGPLRHVAPLLRGGFGPLEDAATALRGHAPFSATRWTLLFDEVEFLSAWQQGCLYEFMARPSKSTSCKVATLPYAHTRAMREFGVDLVLGDD